jgi:hypothetical protein
MYVMSLLEKSEVCILLYMIAKIEAAKQYQKDHPEVIKAIAERRKERDPDYHQRWQQENPDKVAEYNLRYRERNRDLINKRARERARERRQAARED